MVLRLIKPFDLYCLMYGHFKLQKRWLNSTTMANIQHSAKHYLKLFKSREAAKFSQQKTKVNNLSAGSF